MVWRRSGDKPLSEPMMVSLLTHICVTRPQWVNQRYDRNYLGLHQHLNVVPLFLDLESNARFYVAVSPGVMDMSLTVPLLNKKITADSCVKRIEINMLVWWKQCNTVDIQESLDLLLTIFTNNTRIYKDISGNDEIDKLTRYLTVQWHTVTSDFSGMYIIYQDQITSLGHGSFTLAGSLLAYQDQQVCLGAVSIRKTVLPGMAIPMLKIRRPNGRLIFNMEIAIRR